MADMKLTEEGKQRIAKLLADLGKNEELRERFERDARDVLNEYGLGRVVPAGVDLEVVVDSDTPAAVARLAESEPRPIHMDLAHIDESAPFPAPLPPSHLDLSHTDAVLLTGTQPPRSVLHIRGVIER